MPQVLHYKELGSSNRKVQSLRVEAEESATLACGFQLFLRNDAERKLNSKWQPHCGGGLSTCQLGAPRFKVYQTKQASN